MTDDEITKQILPESLLAKHPDYVNTIGLISVELNNLETHLALMLGGLLGKDDAERALVIYLTPKSSRARLEILENAVKFTLADDEAQRGLLSIIVKANKILTKRNLQMHSVWGEIEGKVCRWEPPLMFKAPIHVELQELKDMLHDIRSLIIETVTAYRDLYEQHPFQRKPE